MELAPSLRASDADREQVGERLRFAASEGRLTGDELEERLETLYSARTYGDLDALVADLPVARPRRRSGVRIRGWVYAVAAGAIVLCGLGMLALTRGHTAVAVVGAGHLRHLALRGPLPPAHQGLFVAASTCTAVIALLSCAALLWFLRHPRSAQAR